MEDYPRDLLELEARFSTEAACREYLARLRWPEGFRCPHCGGAKGVAGSRRAARMRGLRRTDLSDRRDDFPGHADSFAGLVSRHVVGDDAKERCQRVGPATGSGSEEL